MYITIMLTVAIVCSQVKWDAIAVDVKKAFAMQTKIEEKK